MIYFGIQLYETILTHKIFLFELFVIYVWLIWTIKYVASRQYVQYNNDQPTSSMSVIVPCLNEKPHIFDKCLQSIVDNTSIELIVVFDATDKNTELRDIAEKYTEYVYDCGDRSGKRTSVIYGLKKSKGDIIILADSDSIFVKDTIKNLIKPFHDDEVGGVTTKQHIIDPNKNILRKFANWMEHMRFSITIPAQSIFGGVGCLPGRAIAFRREIIEKHINEFLNETFLGVRYDSGDDRFLTSMALKDGWKTVYQSSAEVYTDCPDNWLKFIKQQIRWARSSQRETILSMGWLWKRPFTFFVFTTDIITPIIFVIVVMWTVYQYVVGQTHFNMPLSLSLIIGVIGMNISLGLRQYPHLKICKSDILYLPLYTMFMTFVMIPIRIYGLVTIRNNKWNTRTEIEANKK